jgi:HD-GYP domain-containing protein (c-di-GMP phosphodiesterase class II)
VSRTNTLLLEFIRHLLSATTNASLYGMEHPQVTRLISKAFDTLLTVLDKRQEFSFAIIENELVIDGRPQDFNLFLSRFIQILTARRIEHIKLLQGITQQEITEFITAMARHDSEQKTEIRSTRHLQLGRIEIVSSTGHSTAVSGASSGANDSPASGKSPTSGTVDIQKMPAKEMARFVEIYEAVKNRKKFKINGIIEIVTNFVTAFREGGQALLLMAALRETDEYTFTHSTNVCILNIAQAISLGIGGQLLNDIGVAGMLHDIGKLFIPEEIIIKKNSLSNEELKLMQSHPLKGANYLLDTPGVPRLAIVNAFEHHLKYNLSGYPKVPAMWTQSLASQMTTISDIFDALRTRRSYHEPLPPAQICYMMNNMAGTELHPALTANFIKILSHLLNNSLPFPCPATP